MVLQQMVAFCEGDELLGQQSNRESTQSTMLVNARCDEAGLKTKATTNSGPYYQLNHSEDVDSRTFVDNPICTSVNYSTCQGILSNTTLRVLVDHDYHAGQNSVQICKRGLERPKIRKHVEQEGYR